MPHRTHLALLLSALTITAAGCSDADESRLAQATVDPQPARAEPTPERAMEQAGQAAHQAPSAARDAAETAMDKTGQAAETVIDKTRELAGKAVDGAKHLAAEAAEATGKTLEQAGESLEQTAQKLEGTAAASEPDQTAAGDRTGQDPANQTAGKAQAAGSAGGSELDPETERAIARIVRDASASIEQIMEGETPDSAGQEPANVREAARQAIERIMAKAEEAIDQVVRQTERSMSRYTPAAGQDGDGATEEDAARAAAGSADPVDRLRQADLPKPLVNTIEKNLQEARTGQEGGRGETGEADSMREPVQAAQ